MMRSAKPSPLTSPAPAIASRLSGGVPAIRKPLLPSILERVITVGNCGMASPHQRCGAPVPYGQLTVQLRWLGVSSNLTSPCRSGAASAMRRQPERLVPLLDGPSLKLGWIIESSGPGIRAGHQDPTDRVHHGKIEGSDRRELPSTA